MARSEQAERLKLGPRNVATVLSVQVEGKDELVAEPGLSARARHGL